MTSPYLLDDRSGQALSSIEAAIDEMSEIDLWRFYGDARRIREAADRLSAYAITIERMHEARALQAAE